MNDTLIRSFLSIAKEGSFNKAAEKLYTSQPNLSRSIARLEKELNVQLFDRTGKRAELTESGRVYLAAFLQMERCMEEAREKVDLLRCVQSGIVRVGYVQGWDITAFIQPVLRCMRERYPDIKIALEAYPMQELLAKFNFEQLDLILTMQGWTGNVADRSVLVIDQAQKGILYAKRLMHFQKTNPEPLDFKDEIFYVKEDIGENSEADYVRGLGVKYGFSPRISAVNNLESILTNVENGLGVAICNSWMRSTSFPEFGICGLKDVDEIAVSWKVTRDNRALDLFLDVMQQKEKEYRITA